MVSFPMSNKNIWMDAEAVKYYQQDYNLARVCSVRVDVDLCNSLLSVLFVPFLLDLP